MLTELDPQVRDLLQQFRANTAQHAAPATQLSVHERIVAKRERLKNLASQVGLPSEPVSETRDFAIRSRATVVPARLYVPASTQVPLRSVTPALLYYHGGGFVAGTSKPMTLSFEPSRTGRSVGSFRWHTVSPRRIRTLPQTRMSGRLPRG